MLWGLTGTPWLWLSAALGVWLLFAPNAFGIGIGEQAAHSDHLAGALIIVVAIIALAEVARPARFLNVLLGSWLVLAPWFLSGGNLGWRACSTLTGLAVVVCLSLPLGKLRDHYGSFDRALTWSPRAKSRDRLRRWRWSDVQRSD